ncbi:MAG TPA: phospho-N-acetylmuramoyl-pentapeptide-transferase, partial [Spirochaetia bacterium]|nr:phospho-N-acetylmuramoyl-pentapeptide-transferase [Spirochaetia bacterium]
MLKELLLPLVKYASFFNVLKYITFRAAYAAITALLISFVFGPKFIRTLKRLKLGQSVRPDGPETHLVKTGTPTMGGILIIFSVFCSVLLWQDLRNLYTWIATFSLLSFGALGFVDDYLKITKKNSNGLKAWVKLMWQTIIATVIVVFLYVNRNDHTTLLYLPFIKYPVFDLSAFYIPFGIFWLVGFSNAVNLTDGLDGLAIGLVMLVCIAFTVLSYLTGRADYAAYLLIPYLPESAELTIFCFAL